MCSARGEHFHIPWRMPMGDANDDDSKGQMNGSEKGEITFVIHHFGLISI